MKLTLRRIASLDEALTHTLQLDRSSADFHAQCSDAPYPKGAAERCLRALALMRLVNPRAEIRAAGGREGHLRSLGALVLWPANSLFVEGYLTTRGDAVKDTYRMITDAGFEVAGNPLYLEHEESTVHFEIPGGGEEVMRPDIAAERRGPAPRAS